MPDAQWGQANQYVRVWSRERFIARPGKEMGVLCPPGPELLHRFSKALLKARWWRGVVSCCKLLGIGILRSCNDPLRSGHDVTVNLQQDKCYSLFFNFLSLCECCCCWVASVVSDSVQPHRRQPLESPIPGILQARTLEWVAISFSNAWKWKVKMKSLSHIWLLATPWTAAYQAPPSMEFSRQEYWSGVPLPSPSMWME